MQLKRPANDLEPCICNLIAVRTYMEMHGQQSKLNSPHTIAPLKQMPHQHHTTHSISVLSQSCGRKSSLDYSRFAHGIRSHCSVEPTLINLTIIVPNRSRKRRSLGNFRINVCVNIESSYINGGVTQNVWPCPCVTRFRAPRRERPGTDSYGRR